MTYDKTVTVTRPRGSNYNARDLLKSYVLDTPSTDLLGGPYGENILLDHGKAYVYAGWEIKQTSDTDTITIYLKEVRLKKGAKA